MSDFSLIEKFKILMNVIFSSPLFVIIGSKLRAISFLYNSVFSVSITTISLGALISFNTVLLSITYWKKKFCEEITSVINTVKHVKNVIVLKLFDLIISKNFCI